MSLLHHNFIIMSSSQDIKKIKFMSMMVKEVSKYEKCNLFLK